MCNCRNSVQISPSGEVQVTLPPEHIPEPSPSLPPGILYMPQSPESSNITVEPEVSLQEQLTPRTTYL